MTLALIKAHAYGNDFLIAPVEAGVPEDGATLAVTLCDRHRGIGADGLIFAARTPGGARTQLFNADGSRAEVSGNGVRCVAAWLGSERTLAVGGSLTIDTAAGPKALTLLDATGATGAARTRLTFRANMGQPADITLRRLDIAGESLQVSVLSMGNPQCVIFGDVTEPRLHAIGGLIAVHRDFPEGTNVELARLEAPDHVRILIWERGVGPTSSSGTGTCAAAVAAVAHHGASRSLDVSAPGGRQHVDWTDEGVMLVGWAELVARVDWPFTRAR